MPFADHQFSFRQRRRLREAAIVSGLFALASVTDVHSALVAMVGLAALGASWRVWRVRHDDPRDGWTAG